MTDAATGLVVTARPVRTRRIAIGAASIILVIFAITALALPHANAGARVGIRDQVGIAIVGLIVSGTALLPTRPRLEADVHEVRTRAYLGGFRRVPWTLVNAVEFPERLRFARLVLPGDETVTLYAVQRYDRARSVAAMRGLRALLAQSRQGA